MWEPVHYWRCGPYRTMAAAKILAILIAVGASCRADDRNPVPEPATPVFVAELRDGRIGAKGVLGSAAASFQQPRDLRIPKASIHAPDITREPRIDGEPPQAGQIQRRLSFAVGA